MKKKYYLRFADKSILLDNSCGNLKEVFTNKKKAKKALEHFNEENQELFCAIFDEHGKVLFSAIPNLVKYYRENGCWPVITDEQKKAFGIFGISKKEV